MARINGNNRSNTLNGTSSNDTIYGLGGNDSLFGNAGNDVLEGGTGADHMDGGDGIDRVEYWRSSSAVTVNLALGYGLGGEAQGDTYVSIEDVYGSRYDDTITGNGADNLLYGRNGDDTLNGGDGNDDLYGGDLRLDLRCVERRQGVKSGDCPDKPGDDGSMGQPGMRQSMTGTWRMTCPGPSGTSPTITWTRQVMTLWICA